MPAKGPVQTPLSEVLSQLFSNNLRDNYNGVCTLSRRLSNAYGAEAQRLAESLVVAGVVPRLGESNTQTEDVAAALLDSSEI